MSAAKVTLKDPVFAAFLAFLVPGLGHLYQRRTFKGALYGICILGTFFFGMRLGNGKVVYFDWEPEKRTWAYLCQFWTGLPALPALTQVYLRPREALEPNRISGPMSSPFQGKLRYADNMEEVVTGKFELEPDQQNGDLRQWRASLTGTLQTTKGPVNVVGRLTDVALDPQVAPDARRRVSATFEGQAENHVPGIIAARLEGSIPRSVWNSYLAPLQDDDRRQLHPGEPTDLERAHAELGTRFELGVVYTMIAGLLNILAIYDALEGPAYGDEEEREEKPAPAPPPVAAAQALGVGSQKSA